VRYPVTLPFAESGKEVSEITLVKRLSQLGDDKLIGCRYFRSDQAGTMASIRNWLRYNSAILR
jgi:hypothetical protein